MLSNTTRMFVLEFLFRHKTSLEILSILQGYKIRKSLSCRLRLPKRTHLNSAPKIFRFVSFFSEKRFEKSTENHKFNSVSFRTAPLI